MVFYSRSGKTRTIRLVQHCSSEKENWRMLQIS